MAERELWVWHGRRHERGGMTLAELRQAAGGMDYVAVAAALRRLEANARRVRALRSALRTLDRECATP